MSMSGSEILALSSNFATCFFPSQMVKRSHLIEQPIRENIRFNNTITTR